jgi:YVTN family beta-propeller protein
MSTETLQKMMIRKRIATGLVIAFIVLGISIWILVLLEYGMMPALAILIPLMMGLIIGCRKCYDLVRYGAAAKLRHRKNYYPPTLQFEKIIKKLVIQETREPKRVDVIKIEKGPHFMSINPVTNRIYLSNCMSDAILVIDCLTNTVIDTIKVPKPTNLIVNPKTNKLYVISNVRFESGYALGIIDLEFNKQTSVVCGFDKPKALTVNPNTNVIYVVNSDSILAIDGFTNNLVETISVKNPDDITIDHKTNKLYLVKKEVNHHHNIVVINGSTRYIIAGIDEPGVSEVYINPALGWLYVLNRTYDGNEGGAFEWDSLYLISCQNGNIVKCLRLKEGMHNVAIDYSTNKLFLVNSKDKTFYTLSEDLERVVETMELEKHLSKIILNPSTNNVYIIKEYGSSNSLYITEG